MPNKTFVIWLIQDNKTRVRCERRFDWEVNRRYIAAIKRLVSTGHERAILIYVISGNYSSTLTGLTNRFFYYRPVYSHQNVVRDILIDVFTKRTFVFNDMMRLCTYWIPPSTVELTWLIATLITSYVTGCMIERTFCVIGKTRAVM